MFTNNAVRGGTEGGIEVAWHLLTRGVDWRLNRRIRNQQVATSSIEDEFINLTPTLSYFDSVVGSYILNFCTEAEGGKKCTKLVVKQYIFYKQGWERDKKISLNLLY